MTPDLKQFTEFARADPKVKFNSLMGLLFRQEGLLDSFSRLAKNKAAGVDGIKKAEYEIGLLDRVAALSSRMQRGGYTPQPVRRVFIPKASGSGRRPLGIPAFEDRIVQDRASLILQAIWEPEFLDCSFGFRPGKSAHDALRRVDQIVMQGRTKYVVEADIKGFFTHVSHDWLVKFLEHRIADRRFVRTLHRFLKAGVMEDGVLSASEEGTPQGGLVSPVLSNVYLHYVLDLWFVRSFSKSCMGKAHLVRYCDDFVAFFECEVDAIRFRQSLDQRLGKFGLEVEPSKTQTLRFCAADRPSRRGSGSRTFSFLGFTHFIKKSRSGRPILAVKTAGDRMRRKLKELHIRLRRMRFDGARAMVTYASQHLRGHLQYYGVSGNMRELTTYALRVRRSLHKWLNRRSQRRSYTWPQLMQWLTAERFPSPRIVHNLWAH